MMTEEHTCKECLYFQSPDICIFHECLVHKDRQACPNFEGLLDNPKERKRQLYYFYTEIKAEKEPDSEREGVE